MTLVEDKTPVPTPPAAEAARSAEQAAPETNPLGRCAAFWSTLAGCALLWLSFPPVGFAWLAWLAPLPWLWLIGRRELPGKRPYRQIYLASFLGWMLLLNWLRLPHWACAAFGWPAISFYLAFYLPVFVGLSRVAVWRLRVPLAIAAPVVWVGLELLRGHLLTGFSMYLLGHALVDRLELIQIADLGGAYAVSLLVMFVAAAVTTLCFPPQRETRLASRLLGGAVACALAIAAFGGTWAYGTWRLEQPLAGEEEESPRIALIQGSIDTVFGDGRVKPQDAFEHYLDVNSEAAQALGPVDLYVWPETMFYQRYVTHSDDAAPRPGEPFTPEEFAARLERAKEVFALDAAWLAGRKFNTPMLVGAGRTHLTAERNYEYNSALLITTEGEVAACYNKMHPVMFGEYVPFGYFAPIVYNLTPLAGGLSPGEAPVAVPVGDWHLAPSICYESTVPHLIREQVNTLTAAGTPPDALVNLTNDGWFWGSAELDAHLSCSVFRAIECRLPMLVAANTGFSASIDGNGRILQQGPRRDTGFILARPTRDGRESIYLKYGDWLAGVCLVFCGVLAGVGLVGRWRGRRARKRAPAAG